MLLDILLGLHFLTWLAISLRVLSRNDLSSPARLAWIVLLFVLPYFGVLVYWMFGEVHLGLDFNRRHKQISTQLKEAFPHALGNDDVLNTVMGPEYQPAFAYAAAATGFETTLGNRAQLLANALETQERMIADFDAATDHIHVLYYIWLDDGMGNAVAQALIRAAKRGVSCRAMVDGLGSRSLLKTRLWKEMREAGVEVSVALPIHNLLKVILFSRIDLRNHRKITVIDGKVAYVGSRNSADPEFRVKPKYAPWVDIMLRVEGPVVAQKQMLFASDWLMHNPKTPLESFPHLTEPQPNGFAAQVFSDGPNQRHGVTPQFLSTLISQAQHRLVISTPYFAPDYSLISMLCATAYRGVDVTIIFPKKNDSIIVAATSHSYYCQMLDAGVKIYEYKPGLLHAKTLTIDGQISLIGSTNLDLRSFDLNYENNILLYDKALTEDIIERQQQYIADSDIVTCEQVHAWPLYRRIWNNIVATMGPLL